MYLYKITNLINGKAYIGQTIRENVNEHCSRVHQNSPISHALKKYGIQSSKITACCKGRRKRAGGFTWTYLTELQGGMSSLS